MLASHRRVVFTARTRPAFRSPQSLRRPPDDVTALATLLVVMMTSPGGCTPAAPAALPREEGCRKAIAFLCTPPPFQPGSSLHHHLRGHFSHPFHTCFITAGPLRAVTHTTPLNNPSAREGERAKEREQERVSGIIALAPRTLRGRPVRSQSNSASDVGGSAIASVRPSFTSPLKFVKPHSLQGQFTKKLLKLSCRGPFGLHIEDLQAWTP